MDELPVDDHTCLIQAIRAVRQQHDAEARAQLRKCVGDAATFAHSAGWSLSKLLVFVRHAASEAGVSTTSLVRADQVTHDDQLIIDALKWSVEAYYRE